MQQTRHFYILRDGKPRFFVCVTLKYEQGGPLWRGECIELGTAIDANTLPQVQHDLVEMVEDHLLMVAESENAPELWLAQQGVSCFPIPEPSESSEALPISVVLVDPTPVLT